MLVNGDPFYTFPSVILQPGELYVSTYFAFDPTDIVFELEESDGTPVDAMSVPGWDNAVCYGRTGAPPYASIEKMAPTPGKINKGQVAIPEFGDLLLPLAIMPFMLFVIRRTRKSKGREKGSGGTQLG